MTPCYQKIFWVKNGISSYINHPLSGVRRYYSHWTLRFPLFLPRPFRRTLWTTEVTSSSTSVVPPPGSPNPTLPCQPHPSTTKVYSWSYTLIPDLNTLVSRYPPFKQDTDKGRLSPLLTFSPTSPFVPKSLVSGTVRHVLKYEIGPRYSSVTSQI